jgi:hypothetical protein
MVEACARLTVTIHESNWTAYSLLRTRMVILLKKYRASDKIIISENEVRVITL